MNYFNQSTYIDIIQEKLKENQGSRGYQASMARAMNVHGSYLSRAIQGKVNLTPDQAVHLAGFWEMRPLETDYFLALVNLARAGTDPLKAHLKEQIANIQKRQQDLSLRFQKHDAKQASETYYSAWYYSAIHLLLTVPGFFTAKTIAARLGLDTQLTSRCLKDLEAISLAKRSGDRWQALQNDLHLGNASFWAHIHHSNWRQKAILKSQERSPGEIHFTGIHAVSREDFEKMKNIFLDAIEKTRKIAGPSKEEDIFYFSVDAFRV